MQKVVTRPLDGIKIVDLSTVIFGPLASQTLADYGADVIKVEAPSGDSTRATGPAIEPGMSAIFLGANRNKRSIVLDLKKPAAREALATLIADADVLMHNVRPQKLAALDIEPDAILSRHPRIIYAALNGFRADGHYGGNPAYDDIIQGLSGISALMEEHTGSAKYLPTAAADKIAAQVATHAILAALFRRERTGQGGYVEIPMFEATVAFNLVEHYYGAHFEPPLSASGYPRVLNRNRRPYPTSDGHVCMMPYTDAHWRRFFIEAGASALAEDSRFVDIRQRTQNIDALYDEAVRLIALRTTAEWLAICERVDIPAARMNRLADLADDPHLAGIGFFERRTDARMGTVRFPGIPVRFDGESGEIRMPPRLGENTREILAEAGLSITAVDALLASGAARQASEP
jgi:crotonobetainyl-CoA:carnitine CoA-transferase CaiB-like acyl-CoA transferase